MRLAMLAILALFSLSGVAALLYQLVWIRALTHVMGGTTFAISAVLAAYMGGLAFGSRFFGRRGDVARDPLKLYGALELGIGALGAFVLVLLPFLKPLYIGLVRAVPSASFLWKILVALVCWVVYSFAPFARRTIGWSGNRAAWLSAIAFGIVLLNFVPIGFFLTKSHNF